MASLPVALTIAGSDSGGGAGIQADLKAMASFGVYGTSVITAVTAQNTIAVTAVQDILPEVVADQIAAVISDFDVKSIKIGMLSSSLLISTVAHALAEFCGTIVLDPVMVSKSGDALLRESAVAALRDELLPRATLATPNLPEAARLLNTEIAGTVRKMTAQGDALLELGPAAVLMKGGHAQGAECRDVLVTPNAEPRIFVARRIDTRNTHGTGCTLSSAISACLARGQDLPTAVESAHSYLQEAIRAAREIELGSGHGPVDHFYWDTRHAC